MAQLPFREALRLSLTEFRPADELERTHRTRCLELLDVTWDPTSRREFVPGHFTASAFVLAPDGGRVLLIHHRKLGRWLQPGGHIEPDDTDLVGAAGREVREETGLGGLTAAPGGLFDIDIHSIPAFGDEPRHEHFDVRVLFRASTDRIAAGSEVKAARWAPLDEVDTRVADESVMRAVRKLMSRG